MRLGKLVAMSGAVIPLAVASSLLGSSAASAAPCGTVTQTSSSSSGATYTDPGCTYSGLTFSNISITTSLAGGGTVVIGSSAIGTVNPVSGEFGLQLSYSATAPSSNSTADLAWTYDVSGNLISDAYLSLNANDTGAGVSNVTENLQNFNPPFNSYPSLTQNGTGSQVENLSPPVAALFVTKDQDNYVPASAGSANSSILINAFSLTTPAVSEPASLSLLGAACIGLGAILRRRKMV